MTATARSRRAALGRAARRGRAPDDGRGGGADRERLARCRGRRLRHRDAGRDERRAGARGVLLARRRLWAQRPRNVGPAGGADEARLGLPGRRAGRARLVVTRPRPDDGRRHLRGESLLAADALANGVALRTAGLLADWQERLRHYPDELATSADRGCRPDMGWVRAGGPADARPSRRAAGAARADGRRRVAGRSHRLRAEPRLAADAQAARGPGRRAAVTGLRALPSGSNRR